MNQQTRLQLFTVNLEDLEAQCSHIPLKERTQIRKVRPQKWRHKKRKHSIHTRFRKKNNKRSVLRAERYGDLTTVEHKILSEGAESRNKHRFAVVVQVLATQWNPCQTETSQETEKNLRKSLRPSQKRKDIHTDNSLECGKHCEELSWNHRTTTRHQSDTSGIAERAARRAKEETSAVLLQSGSDDQWWLDSMECRCCLREDQDFLAEVKSQNERSLGESF